MSDFSQWYDCHHNHDLCDLINKMLNPGPQAHTSNLTLMR